MKRHWIWLLPFTLTVAGCFGPTAYQPSGYTGGYSEQKVNDSAYIVTFSGNGFATKDRIWYFWIYRCAELTVQNGYDYFYLHQKDAGRQKTERSGAPLPAVYRPGRRAHLVKVHSGGYSPPVYIYGGGGGNVTRWTSSAIVLMFKKPLAKELPFALDAHLVMDQLADFIASNGKGVPPPRAELVRHAFVAHAQINFGPAVFGPAVSAAPTPAATPAPTASVATPVLTTPTLAAPPSRSADDLHGKVDESRAAFYVAYQEHQMRSRDAAPGTVVLAFGISSNGIVTDCHVASSTIADPIFLDTLTTLFRRIDFGVGNVQPATIASFPIVFTPKPD